MWSAGNPGRGGSNLRDDPEILAGLMVSDEFRVYDVPDYPTEHDATPVGDDGNLADVRPQAKAQRARRRRNAEGLPEVQAVV